MPWRSRRTSRATSSRRAVDEQLAEGVARVLLRRHRHAALGPRELPLGDAQHQVGEPRVVADVLGRELVERDAVADVALGVLDPVPLDAGEQALLAVVAAVAQVRHAGEQRERAAVFLQQLQVARGLVVEPRLLGEQERGVQAQVPGDQHQPLGLQGRRPLGGAEAAGEHRVEHRQRDADGPGAEKRAAAERRTGVVSGSS